jgi:hypothetical protein
LIKLEGGLMPLPAPSMRTSLSGADRGSRPDLPAPSDTSSDWDSGMKSSELLSVLREPGASAAWTSALLPWPSDRDSSSISRTWNRRVAPSG